MTQATNQQKKPIQSILLMTGLVFISAGTYGLLNPQMFATLFGNDTEIARIFSGALALAGLGDIVIAKLVIKPTKDRR